jgi:peptidyl-tRNA hydrolase
METKQVIVIRRFYPDGKGGVRQVRNGKLISQAAHASISFLTRRIRSRNDLMESWKLCKDFDGNPLPLKEGGPLYTHFCLTLEEEHWLNNSFKKICLYVNSEEELEEIYNRAKMSG